MVLQQCSTHTVIFDQNVTPVLCAWQVAACVEPNSLCCITDDNFLSAPNCDALGGISVPGSCANALDDELCTANGFPLGTTVRDNVIGERGEFTRV